MSCIYYICYNSFLSYRGRGGVGYEDDLQRNQDEVGLSSFLSFGYSLKKPSVERRNESK